MSLLLFKLLIISLSELGKFDVKNVIHNHMTLDFESFEFEKCENEYWDNCYFVTPTPIKKIYVNNPL